MSLSVQDVETLAPDQASLKSASKLTGPAKWPLLAGNGESGLIWGECQGSGANPYRVVVDENDRGTKCTCPSRKFPCKHALALMWIRAENKAPFSDAAIPDWVTDWLGRRRNTGSAPAALKPSAGPAKSIAETFAAEPEKIETPEALARKERGRAKRAEDKKASLHYAMVELEQWISDQTRLGLAGFLEDAGARCRNIAARLVDFKAQALASRLDELPSRLMALPMEERTEAAIAELGKLVLLSRAWQADPDDAQLMRNVATSETRDQVLEAPNGRRVVSVWEVLAERITTRRDGLVSHATWLMDVQADPADFALLLDFYPASAGARSRSFMPGEQFDGTLVFYPGAEELRAILLDRKVRGDPAQDWKSSDQPAEQDVLSFYRSRQNRAPWSQSAPLLIGAGKLAKCEAGLDWLRMGEVALPVSNQVPDLMFGIDLTATSAIWDGTRLDLLSAQTSIGKVEFVR